MIKFITLVTNGEIIINNKSMDSINASLEKNDIPKKEDSYNYILSIPIFKLSKEELVKLKKSYKDVVDEIHLIKSITIENMWHNDLINLNKELKKYRRLQ